MNEKMPAGQAQGSGRLHRWSRRALVALAMLGLLVGVLVFRAATFLSRQRLVAPVALVAVDAAGAAERLGAAIRIETVSDADRGRGLRSAGALLSTGDGQRRLGDSRRGGKGEVR